MTTQALQEMVREIVHSAYELKNKYTEAHEAVVNYAAIFSQNEKEYAELMEAIKECGSVIKMTPTGPLFQIKPLKTIAGDLRLVKIRKPDSTRPERGDADFTIADFEIFKTEYLSKPHFKLIPREGFEMIELMVAGNNVRVYFSNPPLDTQFGLV